MGIIFDPCLHTGNVNIWSCYYPEHGKGTVSKDEKGGVYHVCQGGKNGQNEWQKSHMTQELVNRVHK